MEVPTYEEYKRATAFARFKYRFGYIVLILCWLSLLYIIFFMVTNVKELAADPLQFACEKMHIECNCYREGTNVNFFVNSSSKWVLKHTYGSPEYTATLDFLEINISK